jgi:O-antigen/teichoic acid export membrane protein
VTVETGVDDEAEVGGGRRRFAAHASWLVSGQAVAKIASFALVIVVTRGLSTVAYGEFSFATSFVPLFLIFDTWGLDVALMRGITREPESLSPLLASGMALRFVLALMALSVALAIGAFLVDGREAFATLVLIGIALLIDECTSLLGTVFNAYEQGRYYALALLTNRIVSTLLALLAVALGGNIVLVSAMYLAGSLGAFIVAGGALRRRFPPVRVRDTNRATIVDLVRHGAPLGAAAALNMVLFRIDATLLQIFDGPNAVGIYGIAYRFLDSFLFVAYALGVVAMPRIARSQWSRDAEEGFNWSLTGMLAFYVPLAVGGIFLAEWAVTLLFSSRYTIAADAVGWLTGAGLFYGIAYLCRMSLAALGHRRSIVVVAAIAVAFNVAVNLWAIPRYGFRGAAEVTFFSEVIESTLLAVTLVRSVRGFRLERVVLVPILAGGAMAAELWALGTHDGVSALLGATTYVLVGALAMSVLAPDARRHVRSLLRGRAVSRSG